MPVRIGAVSIFFVAMLDGFIINYKVFVRREKRGAGLNLPQ
jgi:hypothetical protein